MSEIYVFRNGKYALVNAESEFPTKRIVDMHIIWSLTLEGSFFSENTLFL
jgi:hypothetical protein